MDSLDLPQIALAFGGLLVLLGLFYYAMRYLTGQHKFSRWRQGQRIGVVETVPVDGSRRLVLVRRDDTEHLLLLGNNGDLVVEGSIAVPPAETPAPDERPGWPTLRVPGRDRSS